MILIIMFKTFISRSLEKPAIKTPRQQGEQGAACFSCRHAQLNMIIFYHQEEQWELYVSNFCIHVPLKCRNFLE